MTEEEIVRQSRALLDELAAMNGYAKNRLVARQRALNKEVATLRQQLPDGYMEMDDYIRQAVAVAPAYHAAAQELERISQQLDGWDERRQALQAELMDINGVSYASCITPEVHALVLRRLADGFRPSEVALMAGCHPGTVTTIKNGRYRLSNKPPEIAIGARGRSALNQKTV